MARPFTLTPGGLGLADLRRLGGGGVAIALDAAGEVMAFRCNERTMAPLDIPADLIEPVYAALRTIFGLVYEPAMKVEFQLQSGEALVFDNQRVLHARTAFAGRRHIRQCHVDRDEVFSRLRRLSRDRRP